MDDKLVEDIVNAVREDETYKRSADTLEPSEREEIDAGVRGFAELMAPLLRALDELSRDPQALELAKAKLAEKPTGG